MVVVLVEQQMEVLQRLQVQQTLVAVADLLEPALSLGHLAVQA
mgnify:CR=1 FL=1